jgi:predicted metallo-beta-lactamase superfamily hydrolase
VEVKPLAFDSFGVRSMATYVETKDVRIFIDPGVSLAPRRFGLPPHSVEWERLRDCAGEIQHYANMSDVIIVTHYHYDHHDLGSLIPISIYSRKSVYVKHPTQNINISQRVRRAPLFLNTIKGLPKKLQYADGRSVTYGRTVLRFSEAVCHGTDSKLGYVVEASVRDEGEGFVHTSDVEGPALREQAQFIIREKPNLLIVDGPMGYMLGYRYSQEELEAAVTNLTNVVKQTSVRTIMLEHHFMRNLNYRSQISTLYEVAEERNVKILSAAEYIGRKVEVLEARRRELYEQLPEKTRP